MAVTGEQCVDMAIESLLDIGPFQLRDQVVGDFRFVDGGVNGCQAQ